MKRRPKRRSKSRPKLGMGADMHMRRRLSASSAAGGCPHRMLIIEPSRLVCVAPLRRTSRQKPEAEKRFCKAMLALTIKAL
jgi:hypothetical protein